MGSVWLHQLQAMLSGLALRCICPSLSVGDRERIQQTTAQLPPSLTANTVRRESRSESRGGGSPQAFRVVEGMGFTLILHSAATCRAAKLVFELLAIF